jgi:putative transposase
MANKEHKKYPYLLRNLKVDRPDQAWAGDITYIPLFPGFGYLFAIIDWFSRYVIEWELSNLLDTSFCLDALGRGLLNMRPEIFNTDQGVQFTSRGFVGRLEESGIKVSMDGKGRALDNVFIERLWRSVKWENIYPKGYETLREVRQGLREYFEYYNERRPHQGLGYRTPAEVYFGK